VDLYHVVLIFKLTMLKHHWLNWLIKAWFVKMCRRITNFIGDIGDPAFLTFLCESIQRIDIIVDDASHLNWHQKLAFEALYPCLNPNGGIYIVEDIGTSYKRAYGGSEGMRQSFAGPDLRDRCISSWTPQWPFPASLSFKHIFSDF
jgi:hypothetical protein